MRIDLYTRCVLTAIAGCLLWLCVVLTPWTPLAAAAPQPGTATNPMRVIVHGWTQPDGQVTRSGLGAGNILPVSDPRNPMRVVVQGWVQSNGQPTAAALTKSGAIPVEAPNGIRVAGGKIDELPPIVVKEKQ